MQGLTLCFTNFETKEHLAHLVTLCHYMGASIRKEMSLKIDYLITNSLHGPKYRVSMRCFAFIKDSVLHLEVIKSFAIPLLIAYALFLAL